MSEKSARQSVRNSLRDGASEAANRRNIAEATLRRQRLLDISIPSTNAVNILNKRLEEEKAIGHSEAEQRRGE